MPSSRCSPEFGCDCIQLFHPGACRGQAFLHLVHDLNNCASVPVIFAWQLGKYHPLKKGWFQAPLRPVRRWLGPVIVAAPLLLVVNWIANHPLVSCPAAECGLGAPGQLTWRVLSVGISCHTTCQRFPCWSIVAGSSAAEGLVFGRIDDCHIEWGWPEQLLVARSLLWWHCSRMAALQAVAVVVFLQWHGVKCPCHPQVALPDTEVDLFGQQVLEQSLASGDTVTKAIYFVVLIFCAPFWEEVSTGAHHLAVQWSTAVCLLTAC